MNKHQEALDSLWEGAYGDYSRQYDLLQELIFKETPMKPKVFDSVPRARCNVCNNGIKTYSDSNQIKYCHWCGQRIDWSDDNE